MTHTLQNQKFQANDMLENGMSVSATPRQFGVSRQTARLWFHCYQMTRTASDLPARQWVPTIKQYYINKQ